MTQTTISSFQRRFEEYRQQALRGEPVEITREGRRELVLMSAERFDWLVAAAHRTHRTVDAPEFVVEAVRRASMPFADAPKSVPDVAEGDDSGRIG